MKGVTFRKVVQLVRDKINRGNKERYIHRVNPKNFK